MARAARNRTPLSVLMLDLDGFKPVNDRHGHADGDRVLRDVARTIRSVVRDNDIVARYGGDEFVVVMPDTGEEGAQEVARRVIVDVRESKHEMSDGSLTRVGVSGGLAMYPTTAGRRRCCCRRPTPRCIQPNVPAPARREQASELAAAGEQSSPDDRDERQMPARPPVPTMSPGLGPVPAPTAG